MKRPAEKEDQPLRFEVALQAPTGAQPRRPRAKQAGNRPKTAGVRATFLLAHRFQTMIERGEVHSFEEIAERFGITVSRVIQLMNLTQLAPAIKAHLLTAPNGNLDHLRERHLRPIASRVLWSEQIGLWKQIGREIDLQRRPARTARMLTTEVVASAQSAAMR